MPIRHDYRKIAAVKLARRANTPADKAHLLTLAERLLRPADQLDRIVRRLVIPVPEDFTRAIAPTSSRSSPPSTASMRITAALNDVQLAIGRGLRAEYDLAQPIPARIVDLLGRLEQQDGESVRITRTGCAA
jgi:hypothetical protein